MDRHVLFHLDSSALEEFPDLINRRLDDAGDQWTDQSLDDNLSNGSSGDASIVSAPGVPIKEFQALVLVEFPIYLNVSGPVNFIPALATATSTIRRSLFSGCCGLFPSHCCGNWRREHVQSVQSHTSSGSTFLSNQQYWEE